MPASVSIFCHFSTILNCHISIIISSFSQLRRLKRKSEIFKLSVPKLDDLERHLSPTIDNLNFTKKKQILVEVET